MFVESAAGTLIARFETISRPAVLVPSFVVEHFNAGDATKLERELRSVDAKHDRGDVDGRNQPAVTRFVSAFPGLFHRDGEKGSRRNTMRYLLTRP